MMHALGRPLAAEFGRGFAEKNLRRMVQFAETFPDAESVAALLRQLGWTHFTMLVPMRDPLKRDFYAEMCRVERWSTRTLQQKISGMLYERTALSPKPDLLIRKELDALRAEDRLTPDLVFQDPLRRNAGPPEYSGRPSCRDQSLRSPPLAASIEAPPSAIADDDVPSSWTSRPPLCAVFARITDPAAYAITNTRGSAVENRRDSWR